MVCFPQQTWKAPSSRFVHFFVQVTTPCSSYAPSNNVFQVGRDFLQGWTKNVQGKHQLMWRNTLFNVMIFWPRIPTIYCILTMPMFVLFFQATASKTPYCQRLHPCLFWDSRIWSWPDLMNIFSMFLAILSQNTFSDVQGDFQWIEWHNLEQHKRWGKKNALKNSLPPIKKTWKKQFF